MRTNGSRCLNLKVNATVHGIQWLGRIEKEHPLLFVNGISPVAEKFKDFFRDISLTVCSSILPMGQTNRKVVREVFQQRQTCSLRLLCVRIDLPFFPSISLYNNQIIPCCLLFTNVIA